MVLYLFKGKVQCRYQMLMSRINYNNNEGFFADNVTSVESFSKAKMTTQQSGHAISQICSWFQDFRQNILELSNFF